MKLLHHSYSTNGVRPSGPLVFTSELYPLYESGSVGAAERVHKCKLLFRRGETEWVFYREAAAAISLIHDGFSLRCTGESS